MHYLNLTLPAKFQTEDKTGSLHTISSISVSLYANPGASNQADNSRFRDIEKIPISQHPDKPEFAGPGEAGKSGFCGVNCVKSSLNI